MTKTYLRNALLAAVAATTLTGAPAIAGDKAQPAPQGQTAPKQAARGEQPSGQLPRATKSLEIPFEEVTFVDSGYAPYGPRRADDHTGRDLMVANGYGDVTNGPHATLTKFPKGFRSALHTHSGDYYGFVITGVMENYRPGDKDIKKLGAGSYWFQKGGEPHVTECLSEDCTVVLVQDVAFDAQIQDTSIAR